MGLIIVPSLFTIANMIFGVLSINYTLHQQYQWAATMILFSMMMDFLDGKIARRLEVSSNFGKELDSLADVVSFGVAPAILINAQVLGSYQWVGLMAAIWFAVAGALRLARFNVQNISGYFVGVPITAAGSLLAFLNLMPHRISPALFLLITVLLAFLMISKIKVPKF